MLYRKLLVSWMLALIWILLLYQPKVLHGSQNSSHVASSEASSMALKIGALLSANSIIGQAAELALEIAVEHINGDPSLLNGIELNLWLADSNYSALQGATAAMQLLNAEVIAIAGPQTSTVSHFVSHLARATRVPLISFGATDPALSEFQYPYFTRVVPSDSAQMDAVAGVIRYYGWREVIAFFTDDDYGRDAMSYLHYALEGCGSKLIYTAALDPKVDKTEIFNLLTSINLMESRIFVVHMQPDMARILFSTALSLRMVATGYVWLVTDSVSRILDTIYLDNDTFLQATQGVIGTRSYIPESPRGTNFTTEWKGKIGGANPKKAMMDIYALYAYDSVWLIAHAIEKFLRHGGRMNFVDPAPLPDDAGGQLDLAKLKVLVDGDLLLHYILESEFTGVTGHVKLDANGDRLNPAFEVVNMVGKGLRVVGYWTNVTGCSSVPPAMDPKGALQASNMTWEQHLHDVIWPGGHASKPRGWVIPKNGKPLIIGVPHKTGYDEFVSTTIDPYNATAFHGFCIDVFKAAISYLPYAVPHKFVAFGNGTPNYDAMVEKIANKEFDAIVGDLAITTKRAHIVDFTQPYTTSGLVVVVPIRSDSSNHAWAFMRPFTPALWSITGAFFLFTGLVIWMLEHKKNRDFRGRPKKQFVTTLWFIFSTLFFAQREDVKSTLGRAVLIIWLFVVLIIISSYTASLTSILTVQQLRPTIQGISGLVASDVPIGYQAGTFVKDYLLQLGVHKERLIPLNTMASYGTKLFKGAKGSGVGAIVEELPYVQVFLSTNCRFTISGQQFTKSGWGFAFPKGSQLAIDMSTAILTLSENGDLQRIYDTWIKPAKCDSYIERESDVLSLPTFWGLFLVSGLVSVLCVVVYYIRMFWQYHHNKLLNRSPNPSPQLVNNPELHQGGCTLKSFRNFMSFIEKAEIRRESKVALRDQRNIEERI